MLTYLPAYLLNFLISYLLTYLLNRLFAYLLTYFLTYVISYLLSYFLLTHLIIYSLTYLLTPKSSIFLEKLTGSHLVKKFPALYGTKGSLPHSQVHATCPTLNQFDPVCTPHPTSWRSILILFSHLRLSLQVVSFPQVSPPKPCKHLSPPPYALHAPPISFFFILSLEQYWVRSTDH